MRNRNDIVDNSVKDYTGAMYESGPVKLSDYIESKYDVIHRMLYEEALEEYLESIGCNTEEYRDTHKFIEVKPNEYHMPSKVVIMEKGYPYGKSTIDLTPWWNTYEFDTSNKDTSQIMSTDEAKDAEVVWLDYMRGIAKFRSRMAGSEFHASFDYLNRDTRYSEDMSLMDTMGHKLRKIRNA